MERVVVLTIDEASVVIGLLDEAAAGRHPVLPAELRQMAQRYMGILWTRVIDVEFGSDGDDQGARSVAAVGDGERLRAQVGGSLDERRRARARQEELVAAVRAAMELVGHDGPLPARSADDGDLADLRALLETVAGA